MEQKILTAEGLSGSLPEVWREQGTTRVLLVCGASFRRQPLYGRLLEIMKSAGVGCTEFSEYEPNPRYESVVKGIEVLRRDGCDFVLAAGGGSGMDVAKCIKLFYQMDLSKSCLHQQIVENDLPLMAIPTTAGTGSEATRFAVIYENGIKQSVSHTSCIPGWALLDPALLETLPVYQRKATMLDAFCHAAESFWSVNSTPESREDAAEAIRLTLAYGDGYLANDPEGNAKMLLASNLAGKAINVTQTTAGHAMAYKLTTFYGLAHGHAVALCVDRIWPYMIGHTEDGIDPRGKEYLDGMFAKLGSVMGCASASGAAEKYHVWLSGLGLSVPDLKDEEELSLLADSVNPERLNNNPVRLERETLKTLYREILN
ncbi:MAG: phosphonoacetaldehyde reductase [Eubacteriales bacterium]|nr:phosphonoacetaldehyde reductase [Eubacteriales bacterium]